MKKQSVAMVVYGWYPSDPRVRREAEALVSAGISVDVICLRESGQLENDVFNDVGIHRMKIKRSRSGIFSYIFNYTLFILSVFLHFILTYPRKKYDLIHIHNMPDVLVISSIIPKIFGAKIILDLHDPMPEVFMTKYGLDYSNVLIRTLISLEKFCIKYSNLIITPNLAFKEKFIERGCPEDKIHIIMNSPQEHIFDSKMLKNSHRRSKDKFSIMYHGTIVERHGLILALEAVAQLKDRIPNIVFNVYGDGNEFVERFKSHITKLGLENIVVYHGKVNLEAIAAAIVDIDVGIIPNEKTVFTEINLPTRIFEYLSLDKSVIVPKTQGICDYFDENSIFFFESGNADSLARTILQIFNGNSKYQEIVEKGISIYNRHRWENQKSKLINLVTDLLN
jgi:glycosyltransferase involved in cell wall biosynthesis